MSGFDDMWREKILGFNAHLTVSAPGGIQEVDEVLRRTLAVPGVAAAAPGVEGPVVLQHGGRVFTPLLRGVSPELERRVSRIPTHITAGQFDVRDDRLVIGRDLAERMDLAVGDTVLISAPQTLMAADELRLPEEFTVAGVFDVGMWEYDMGFAFCSLEKGQDMFGLETAAGSVRVMTEDPYRAGVVAADLRTALGPPYAVTTWMEQNRQLFGALRVEKNMMFFLLIFITIVAAFGITNTLITVAVNKTREIGLLKAIGFRSGAIMRVFFWLGWIEGTVGAGAGVAAALVALRYRNDLMHWLSETFHLELFPKELYRLSEIPSRTSPLDVAVVVLSVIAICTLAGLIPAYRAARLDPVQALRHE
jgi:lipoprotein-releasing system permease protein